MMSVGPDKQMYVRKIVIIVFLISLNKCFRPEDVFREYGHFVCTKHVLGEKQGHLFTITQLIWRPVKCSSIMQKILFAC